MEINNIKSYNQNFNGYKNVIAKHIGPGRENGLSIMSLQLNNNGHNDLDAWKRIQKNLFNKQTCSDVMTLEHLKNYRLESIYLNNKDFSPKQYGKEGSTLEMEAMKAFTWLANITKRLMNDSHLVKDKEQANVVCSLITTIIPAFDNNYSAAQAIALDALYKGNHPQEIALEINNAIQKMMLDYFN